MSVAEIPSTNVWPWLADRRYGLYHVTCLALVPVVLLATNPLSVMVAASLG